MNNIASRIALAVVVPLVGAVTWGGTIVLGRWLSETYRLSAVILLAVALGGFFPAFFSQAPVWWVVQKLRRGLADVVLIAATTAQSIATIAAIGAFEALRKGGTEGWLDRGWRSSTWVLLAYIFVTLILGSWGLMNQERSRQAATEQS